jgi:beta-lactam-binding protein with PASTA domain
MPDVSGHSEQPAATSLSRAGLLASLFFVPASEPLGKIVQQSPLAGDKAPQKAQVLVFLGVRRG